LKILIADDHTLFRESLSLLLLRLDDEIPTIIQANNSEHAIRLAEQNGDLDMILMDIDMPGISGMSAIKALKNAVPDVPIIMVSAEEGSHQISRAIELGAKGFIPKTTPADVMLSALRLVLNGGIYLPEQLLAAYQNHGGDSEPEKQLTPRQMEILRLLQKGEQNKNIAHQLNLSESTVKVHVRRIFTILDARNRSQAVNHAIERGIL
jgi:DNA-binding NarL/FixJ family response regulator